MELYILECKGMGNQPVIKKKRPRNESNRGGNTSIADKERRENAKKAIVLNKLTKSRKKLGLDQEELEEMASVLSNADRMKATYFGDLLRSVNEAVEAVGREKMERRGEIRNAREQESCMKDIAREAYRIQTIEVQLGLCTLKTPMIQNMAELIARYIRRFEYGAFHAAIIVNGIVLEWNDSNVVIPQKATQTQWAFCGNLHSL